MSALAASPTLIPMAFHVDYWDYLGWRDPFADAPYTQAPASAFQAWQ